MEEKKGKEGCLKLKSYILRPDPKMLLEWFRDEAEREGRGYQTEINQALRNYIKQDKRPIQEIVREVVRKELKVVKKAS